MKKIILTVFLIILIFVLFPAFLFSCGRNNQNLTETQGRNTGRTSASAVSFKTASASSVTEADIDSLTRTLEEIAELERSGSWLPGMALTESTIRENIGDFAGAVAAAYKELAFAYGKGQLEKQAVEQGLLSLLEIKSDPSHIVPIVSPVVSSAAKAILSFSRGQWDTASLELSSLFIRDNEEDPDSFINWMLLVCALEKDPTQVSGEGKRAASAYKSIRSRYAQFPEYWYRGARAFSAAGSAAAAEFAEQCINSSPNGPFSEECRKILAEFAGIQSNEENPSIKTKKEIDVIVLLSMNLNDPKLLDDLFPLISLPDNPYTVYAVNILKTLTNKPVFREYFSDQAQASGGRLSERLSYISRS